MKRLLAMLFGPPLVIAVALAGAELLGLGPKCTEMCDKSDLKDTNGAMWELLCQHCCDEIGAGSYCYLMKCGKLKDPVDCSKRRKLVDLPPCTDREGR